MFHGMPSAKREKEESEWLYGRDDRRELFTGKDIDNMIGEGTMYKLSEARELMDRMKEAERNFVKKDDTGASRIIGKYSWDQEVDEVTVKFTLPEGVRAKQLNVDLTSTVLMVTKKVAPGAPEEILLRGTLSKRVKGDEKVWSVADGVMSITFPKQIDKVHWLSLFEGGRTGEEGWSKAGEQKNDTPAAGAPEEASEAAEEKKAEGHHHHAGCCDGEHFHDRGE
eukprot:Hpha_TRINITY_DN5587_c0_g1::TRINITY_DN5587_c0_g1_i1::g.93795::m.93795